MGRLLAQTDQRPGGNQVIADRWCRCRARMAVRPQGQVV